MKRTRNVDINDWRWNAVVQRSTDADGKFYYSVKTTGVYCRPSCGARLPRRENVQFHTSCKHAEGAGFRPCKRCQPDRVVPWDHYASMVAKACDIITSSVEPPALGALAKRVGMSPFHFHRLFKKIVGLTPKGYAAAHRAERMRNELPKSSTVTEAIYSAGYKSNSRFYEKSAEVLGMPPSAFRKGGIGKAIRVAVGKCSLGFILVASSDKGVCAILLGDRRDDLEKDLRARFPAADLMAGDRAFQRVVNEVVAFVDEPSHSFNLPLDVRGTVFQQRVWKALQAIPPGKTATYSEIARTIGMPASVRAVANACGANAIAVVIPCHRVVRADGSLSGYRWGVKRKRALLEKERNHSKESLPSQTS